VKAIKAAVVTVALATTSADAGISAGWFQYALDQIGKNGKDVLQVVKDEGLILSRIRADYAAFSFGAARLTEQERESDPIEVSKIQTVIEFEMCNSTEELLTGKIYKARFRYHPFPEDENSIQELMEELIEINKYLVSVAGDVRITREVDEFSYVSAHNINHSEIQDILVEFRMSTDVHHIELEATANSVCEKEATGE
jgi:hypothetical protein